MWDTEPIPSAELRAIELCRYSNLTYGTADPDICEAIVRGTPEYSYRGYCEWGVARERELLDAAVAEMRKRNALVLHAVVCAMLSRERLSERSHEGPSGPEDPSGPSDSSGPEGPSGHVDGDSDSAADGAGTGPTISADAAPLLIARELMTLPSTSLRAVCRF
jgi:hypothetical protein